MKVKYLCLMFFLTVVSCSTKAFAHGIQIESSMSAPQAIAIKASYEGGNPMANAQVTVYAPHEPDKVWTKGVTDDNGNFAFVADLSQSGNWDVKVRQAGHGDIISIPLTPEPESTITVSKAQWSGTGNSNYTPMQKMLMTATGIWGCVGTALFFHRRYEKQ